MFRATHQMLARPAAVKLIRSEILGSSTPSAARVIVERFRREAEAAASLRSPHTISLYDFGVAQDGTFFLVMELLDGLDLESLVERFGPVPPERAMYLLRQVCESLEEAHSARSGAPRHQAVQHLHLSDGPRRRFREGARLRPGQGDGRGRPQATLLTAPDSTTGTPALSHPSWCGVTGWPITGWTSTPSAVWATGF